MHRQWLILLMSSAAVGSAMGEDDKETSFPGITRPVRQARLSAQVPGTIQKLLVEEGQAVKSGEVLVQLDNRVELLDLERKTIIAESRAELDAAEQKAVLLKSEWETSKLLFEASRSISKEDLARKDLEHRLASAERDRLLAQEKQEEVERRIAMEQLARRVITAPFDGIVTKVNAKEGEGCDPRQLLSLAEIADPAHCEFVCNVPVSQAAKLKTGERVALSLRGGTGPVEKAGVVAFVSPLADQASGLQEVKVRFSNEDGSVSPGIDGLLMLSAGAAP